MSVEVLERQNPPTLTKAVAAALAAISTHNFTGALPVCVESVFCVSAARN